MQHHGHHDGVSLLDGWLPVTIETLALVLLALVLFRMSRRWWLWWVPVSAGVAGLAVWLVYRDWTSAGVSSDPPPTALWWWVAAAVGAGVLAVLGFRGARWWRRGVSVLAIVATVAALGVSLNRWVGYFPTVQEAWAQITAGPLPDQVDPSALPGLRTAAAHGATMSTGKVVAIDTGSAESHFTHRTEYVYLPPEWFAGASAPHLPAVMMIAGEFNTPADWLRTGHAISTVDDYARAHHGDAPILVFPDVGGSFNNDTECVDGPRGNVAQHLTDEVRPQVIAQFSASTSASNWGVVGWSMGGTCALDLVAMHPDEFSDFVDIAGDAAPDSGNRAQTISRLFGGDAAAYARFDPATVMRTHGVYHGVRGVFYEASGRPHRGTGTGGPGSDGPGQGGPGRGAPGPGQHGADDGSGGRDRPWQRDPSTVGAGLGGRDGTPMAPGSELTAAQELCADGARVGIVCSIHLLPGGHTWQVAEDAFDDSLPELATEVSQSPSMPAT